MDARTNLDGNFCCLVVLGNVELLNFYKKKHRVPRLQMGKTDTEQRQYDG